MPRRNTITSDTTQSPVPIPNEFDKYLVRVGYSSRERWTWLLRVLNHYRKDRGESWVSGEWDIVCGELAFFTVGKRAAPGWGIIPLEDGAFTERPSSVEAQEILAKALEMMESATDRQKCITLGALRIEPTLHWDGDRYVLWERSDGATWLDRVRYPLAQMVSEDGKRLQRCPSKQPHGRKPCANIFLKAKRGKYCSPACASREMSRAKRTRDEDVKLTREKKKARKR